MGFKVVNVKCQECGKPFLAESYQVYRAKLKGRKPCCSRKCEQERRHAESRDRKWREQQLKALKHGLSQKTPDPLPNHQA